MKNIINIIVLVLFTTLTRFSSAQTGIAYIENPQVNGLVFSWELNFERTSAWTPGLLTNALGGSAASFDFNNAALTNPTLIVEPGGPLDNANYPNTTVQIINDKCIVDIQFALNAFAGTLPLNVKTKLLTVNMEIINTNLTAELSWDALNTGFFDNTDATIVTNLTGGSNEPLPVELTSFVANAKNNAVTLNWKTTTEINNYGFDVERKSNVNGQTSNDWIKIGFVSGNGNSNSIKEYSFKDNNLFGGGSYFLYRLKQIDNDGQFEYSDIVEVEVIPQEFELSQNYPNPFNPSTTIGFSLPVQAQLKINIYNMLGELVKTISEGIYEAGYYKIIFDASELSSGTYIYRLQAGSFVETRKMILMK